MSKTTRISLGLRIKALRRAHGLTQARLALMVNIEQSHLSRIESGSRNLSFDLLAKLAAAFDITLSELLDGVE